jgi:Tol biopolymer transport system component
MSAVSERLATAPRVPLRYVGLVALLILALIAAAFYVGSHQRRLPAPFGPAANGLIPYAAGGDIYVGDPVTGRTRLLVGGPETDSLPGYSPDGTKVAFFRDATKDGNLRDLYIVNDDGSHLTQVTAEPIAWVLSAVFAPDGRLAVVHQVSAGTNQLDLYDTTGSGSVQTVVSAVGMDGVGFRPPDGREIMYRALVDRKWGLFAMGIDGSNPRTIAEPTIDSSIDMSYVMATYSADGSRIFYERGTNDGCCRLWVMNADGSDPHEFVPPAADAWDGEAVVSPDGTKVAYWHNPNDGPAHGVAVVRADGTGPVIETGPVLPGGAHWVWSPDSSKILMIPDDGSSTSAYLLDPEGGSYSVLPWPSDSSLDWQRLATN